MSSTVKVLVPLALLVGGVFAVTYLARHTPTEVEGPGGPKAAGAAGPKPLVFFTNKRLWDPTADNLPDRAFPGFYELSERPESAAFWFVNRHPDPVTLQLKSVSCSACTGGRLAAIPPEATRKVLQAAAVGGLPISPVGGGLTGMAEAAANLFAGLSWQEHGYAQDPAKVQYAIPAGTADPWAPQWGILDLQFKVKAPPPALPLKAAFVSQVQGTELVGGDEFSIWYTPAVGIEVDRERIDAVEMTAASAPQQHGFVVFSMTRDDIPPPTVRVELPAGAAGEPGGFVAAGDPVRLTREQAEGFAARMAELTKQPVRVRVAFSVPVTVRPTADGRAADIGKLERVIWVTQGSDVRQVMVKGAVRGPMYLNGEAKEIALGTFKTTGEQTVKAEVLTEDLAAELEVVAAESKPNYLRATVEKKGERNGRGLHAVTVTVPKNTLQGELSDGRVVLRTKGPNPVRLVLPVIGRAVR